MKIKTFQFCVSNFCGNDLHNNSKDWDQKAKALKTTPYSTEKMIDRKVNTWIEKNNAIIKAINVTTYTVDRHNNGYDDTVIMVYTIMYELPEGVENTENTEAKKEEA
jgi:hypothetical protein